MFELIYLFGLVFVCMFMQVPGALFLIPNFNEKHLKSLCWWQNGFSLQQVPDEMQSVMSGVQGYFSLRRRVSDSGFSVFKDVDDTEKALDEKVEVLVTLPNHLTNSWCF